MPPEASPVYEFGPFRLDPAERQLRRDGRLVPLTPKALDTLHVLVERGGHAVSKDELMANVWPDTTVEEATLAQNIFALRKALGNGPFIETVPKFGYRFVTPVRQVREVRRTIEQGSPAAASGTRSIAVLPFKDLAQDPANAHVGIGLADATITELAVNKSLLVRPTAAVMRYQNRAVDAVEVGRELAVDAVVDASFQRSGSRLRVTVQLLATSDGRPLWGSKITTSLDDPFGMQDEVSRHITRALEVQLADRDEPRRNRAPMAGSAAYELYLKGRLHMLRETIDDFNRAVEFFEQARAADAGFARAYVGLADAYLRIAFTWDPDGGWYSRAEAMTQHAMRLDPALPEARYLRGRLLWSPEGGFRHGDALEELGMAIAALPGLFEAHDWMGILLFHVSMFEESAAHFRHALALNPDDDIASMHLGFCRYLEGAFQSAFDLSNDVRRRVPSLWAFYQTALAEIQLGRLDDAERTADTAARQFPGDVLLHPVRATIAALKSDTEAALEYVELTRRNRRSYGHYHHAQYDVACTFAVLGRSDDALAWLTEAARNGLPCHAFFERDPLLASLHQDVRFAALMRDLRAECDGYRQRYHALAIG